MSHAALSALVARTARAVAPAPAEADGALLLRFARTRDEAAFAELVRRLGPLVLGACRRVARDAHAAEDAFQAAFLVLARRARDVRPAEGVRGWLYGVAVRCAQEARAVNARRRRRETPIARLPDRPAEVPEPPDADALAALDEEVAALPEHLRAAVVLCELDGLSRRDAAGRLGVAEGTLSSRLAKARKLLAARLRKRGFVPSAGGLAGLVGPAVPGHLQARTSALASPGAFVPAGVAELSRKVLRTMLLPRLAGVGLLAALAAGALAASAGPVPPPAVERPVAAPVPPAPKAPPPISAPVAYKDLMLVLVTKDGVAAVVFGDADETGAAVAYRFRYESADGKTTTSGKGELFERRLEAGGYDPRGLALTAGPIQVEWSKGGTDRGWIYYAPEAVAVHLANARGFEDREEDIPPRGAPVLYKALDLKRFMRK